MSWLALLAALLLGAWKPEGVSAQADAVLTRWVDAMTRQRLVSWMPVNSREGVVIVLTVALPTVLVGAVHGWLAHASSPLGLLFEIAVLVGCLGAQAVRQRFLAVRDALDREEIGRARMLLGEWMGRPPESLARQDLVRILASHALLQAHRQVLGVMFAFIALSALGLGPAGAVLYRLACLASQRCEAGRAESAASHDAPAARDAVVPDGSAAWPGAHARSVRRAEVAHAVLDVVDHVPSRLTAVGFAVVGHFDQAITVWRRDAGLWDDAGSGVVLAAAGGAAGLDLSPPAAPDAGAAGAAVGAGSAEVVATLQPSATPSDAAEADAADGANLPPASLAPLAALVSRSVLLWMLVLALLTLANVIG